MFLFFFLVHSTANFIQEMQFEKKNCIFEFARVDGYNWFNHGLHDYGVWRV
jgi:hypothetical protein